VLSQALFYSFSHRVLEIKRGAGPFFRFPGRGQKVNKTSGGAYGNIRTEEQEVPLFLWPRFREKYPVKNTRFPPVFLTQSGDGF
jgi:hypothetical protein